MLLLEVLKKNQTFSQTAVYGSTVRQSLFLWWYPQLVAALNGMISYSCCGESLLETECPTVNVNPTNVVDSSFYLKNTKDSLNLSHNHKHYFQIQGQIEYVCNHVLMSCVGPLTKWILNTLSETMNILKAKAWLLTPDPLFFLMLFMELWSIF